MNLITQLSICYHQAYNVCSRILPKLEDSLLHEEYLNQMSSEQVAKLILQKYDNERSPRPCGYNYVYHTHLTNDRILWV